MAQESARVRLHFLDIARVLSVSLVAYGHFASVGGYETALPGIVAPTFKLPIYPCERCALDELEFQLILNLHTQTAVLGVSMFFIITGFLIPAMTDRYTRAQFLINRFLRIFPALIAAVLLVGAVVYLLQGVMFGWRSYLASMTLTYFYVHQAPVIGVLWTLVIEMLFYFTAFAVGRFDLKKIMALQIVMAGVAGAVGLVHNEYVTTFAGEMKFIQMILIGSVLYVGTRDRWGWLRIALGLAEALAVSYLTFQLFNLAHADPRNYGNFINQLVALMAIVGLYLTQRWLSGGAVLAPVYFVSDMVYPIYLIHAVVGLCVMATLRSINTDPLFLLTGAVVASLVGATALHVYVEQPGIDLGRRITRAMARP